MHVNHAFVHSFAHRATVRYLPYAGQCSRPQLERVPAQHRYPPQGYLWFHGVKASPEGRTQSWGSPGVWEAAGDASRRRDPQSAKWLPPCPTPAHIMMKASKSGPQLPVHTPTPCLLSLQHTRDSYRYQPIAQKRRLKLIGQVSSLEIHES